MKPEFNSNEGLSSVSASAHLLAEALLCYADDEGFFNANPVLVRAGTCPLRKDFKNVAKLLDELVAVGYIRVGNCDAKRFGQIVKFKYHQKISHPTASKISKFNIVWESSPENFRAYSESAGESQENASESQENSGYSLEPLCPDQGNGERGTGNGGADSEEKSESADPPTIFLNPGSRSKNRMISQPVNLPVKISDEAQMIASAVIEGIGVTSDWARDQIAKQADQELRKRPGEMDGIRDGMIVSWQEYRRLDSAGKLNKASCGVEKFFSEGRWRSSKTWGLKLGVQAYPATNRT